MPVPPAPILILDFDETLVDKDSSEWVAEQLGAAHLFDDLRWGQGLPWHQAMNAVLRALHSQGCTIAQIRQALSCLPLPCETLTVLRAAHSLGCELQIVSDANTFFIESVLAHHGIESLFTHIHSNPAWIDAKGCLCYADFHDNSLPPHNCPLCPPNMCKGSIVDAIQVAADDPPIIYAGDGSGDLCPSLRLSKHDCALPRHGYPLETLLAQHQVKARVHPWTSLAAAVEESLLDLGKNGGLDVLLNLDGLQASSLCVAASSQHLADLVDRRDGETIGKGPTIAFAANRHGIKSHFVHKTSFSVRFASCSPTRFYPNHKSTGVDKNFTSTHSCLGVSSNTPLWHMRKKASQMRRAVVYSTGHPYQAFKVSCSVYFVGIG